MKMITPCILSERYKVSVKMKKSALYGLMASVSMVSAAAYADDNTTLTTKNYVDSGLRAVYQAANNGLATKADAAAVTALQTVVEGKADTSTVNTALAGKADASTVTALSNAINGVEGESAGLIADVAALQTTVANNDYSGLSTKVTELENIVGDSESGLVNQVSTLETTVAGKADASTVSELATTVSGKANQSDLETLSGVVSGENGLTSQVSALQTAVSGENGLTSQVSALQTAVADNTAALGNKADTSTVSALQTTVGQLQTAVENVNVNYTGENGVTVNNETRKIGFVIEGAVADTPYVYQNGTWSALETVNEWNPNVLY